MPIAPKVLMPDIFSEARAFIESAAAAAYHAQSLPVSLLAHHGTTMCCVTQIQFEIGTNTVCNFDQCYLQHITISPALHHSLALYPIPCVPYAALFCTLPITCTAQYYPPALSCTAPALPSIYWLPLHCISLCPALPSALLESPRP